MAKEKVQITMDSALLADVDKYCEAHYMNRSFMITQACVNVINQEKLVDSMLTLSVSLRSALERGDVDDETRKQIEAFEALSKLFVK